MLDADAVAALRRAGRADVIVARLDPGDVGEDESAARVAAALVGSGLEQGRAGTGRVNLHAARAGLLRIDAGKIDRVNLVSDALTVATLPDYAVVGPRDMVATIKVIPFAVPGAELSAVEAAARTGAAAFTLHPFRALKVGLVLTELPGLKESVTEGTIAATATRVANLGGTLLPSLRCPHAEAPIAAALRQLLEKGAELLLVAGASATVDRRDVGPAGVVAAGGEIVHFGMPVDPGKPHLRRAHRRRDRARAARMRAQPEGQRHRPRAAPPVRRPARRRPRDHADGRRRPAEGDRAATAARAGHAADPAWPAGRGRGASRRAIDPHGAVQQAAGHGPRRQGDGGPRGRQRSVERRAPCHRRNGPSRGRRGGGPRRPSRDVRACRRPRRRAFPPA